MPQPLDWSDLQVFLAVCARGSVGAAAQQLGVNHSTVLRRLGRLEAALKVRLFDRQPAGYALTAQGQAFAVGLEGVDERIASAEREVEGGDVTLSGTVRLTAPDVLLPLVLPALVAFRRAHPAVQIELVQGNAFLSLARREADVAVRGANRVPETLVGRPVGWIQTALFGATGRFSADDAARETWPWIGHTEALAKLASASWIARHVPPERVVLRVDSLLALADAVAAGIGVGWLLLPLAAERSGLDCLQPAEPTFDTRVWVLSHPDLRPVARVKALSDFLYAALSADPRLRHR